MLRRITPVGGRTPLPKTAETAIGGADFAHLFPHSLEFNAPVHNNWNIVHAGMLVPESHQVYICGDNCMRGVVMTAAEMGEAKRFSMVILKEKDLLFSDLTAVTLEGVSDVLKKLPKLPRAVMVFPVCVHHFLGSNMPYVYEKLRERFPGVDFMPCWMDPIMQKKHLFPDQKERRAIYEVLPKLPADAGSVNVLGGVLRTDDQHNDMAKLAQMAGAVFRELPRCKTYDDFLEMGRGELQICSSPMGVYGAKALAKRLGRPYLDMPGTFDFDEIQSLSESLAGRLKTSKTVISRWRENAAAALKTARKKIGGRPVAVDAMAVFRPLGLAKLLCAYGFNVQTIYLDAAAPEEKPAFDWLKNNRPDILLKAPSRMEMRIGASAAPKKDVLAIGPKAAYFENTPYFVQMIDDGGFWGFSGIAGLCGEMILASRTAKNTKALVPLKGLGWKGGLTADV